MARSRKVTQPVVDIAINKHAHLRVYMLARETDCFDMAGRKRTGPGIVIERVEGVRSKFRLYGLSDPRVWREIGTLMKVGSWALSDKQVAPVLLPEFVALSPRFSDTTKEQRQRMANKLPNEVKRKSVVDTH